MADIGAEAVDEAPIATEAGERAVPTRRRGSRRSAKWNHWSRLLHVYISMFSMLVVAFFAITGLTLNHPTWSLGSTSTSTQTGSLPQGAITNGQVDFLAVAEYARDHFDVSGRVKDHAVQGDEGYIDFAGPGYAATVTFSVAQGTVEVKTTQNDLLAILNDIHKGRDTTTSWKWVIDVSAVLLLVVTLTGIGIQVFQPRRRRSSLITMGVLSLVTILLIWLATF